MHLTGFVFVNRNLGQSATNDGSGATLYFFIGINFAWSYEIDVLACDINIFFREFLERAQRNS